MERTEVEALADNFLYILIYNDGLGVCVSTMQDAVTYCCDLVCGLDYSVIGRSKSCHNQFDSLFMGRHILFYNIVRLSRHLCCKH